MVPHASVTLVAPACRSRRRMVLLAMGLCGWATLVLGLFLSLGRERARLLQADPADLAGLSAAGRSGWRAAHVLGHDPALNAALVRHWQARGITLDGGEIILVPAGATRPAGLDRLAASGWHVRATAEKAGVSRLHMLAPDGATIWSGVYPTEDILLAGALIWDRQAMIRVIAGNHLPPLVPAGCSPPINPPADRRAFAWFVRPTISFPVRS